MEAGCLNAPFKSTLQIPSQVSFKINPKHTCALPTVITEVLEMLSACALVLMKLAWLDLMVLHWEIQCILNSRRRSDLHKVIAETWKYYVCIGLFPFSCTNTINPIRSAVNIELLYHASLTDNGPFCMSIYSSWVKRDWFIHTPSS